MNKQYFVKCKTCPLIRQCDVGKKYNLIDETFANVTDCPLIKITNMKVDYTNE